MSSEWIFGINAVESALEHDPEHLGEILTEQGTHNPRVREVAGRAKELGVSVHARTREQLDKLTGGARHQGIVASYARPSAHDERELPALVEAAGHSALFLVLDGVQDPHNLGACLRSAEAAGVTAVIVPKDRAASVTAIV